MDIIRQYIRQWMMEDLKKKFEDEDYKYAYITKDSAEDFGWVIADSIEELQKEWEEEHTNYGDFKTENVLVLKPTTSIDKIMLPITAGDFTSIYPSIKAAVVNTLKIFGSYIDDETKKELKHLLSITDIDQVKNALGDLFDDYQNIGDLWGIYEYVSGPIPKNNGNSAGKIFKSTNISGANKKSTKNYNYYLDKVKQNTIDLKDIPEEFKTAELCKIAVGNYGINNSLEYVPSKFRTSELCKIAAVKNGKYNFQYIPDEFKTPELYKASVESEGENLEYVPDRFKTPELCKIAIINGVNGILEYVPDRFKTPELCKLAVEHDTDNFLYVPDKFITPEMCKIVVTRNCYDIRHVPDKFITPELCKLAIEQSENLDEILKEIPTDIRKQLGYK